MELQFLSEDERRIANFEKQIEQAKANAETLLALDKWTSDERIEIEQRTADAIAAIRGQIAAVGCQEAGEEESCEEKKRQERLRKTAKMFGDLADITRIGGKKTAKITKGLAIAEATINAHKAFSSALASAPWPTNFAAAASALATGLQAVKSIASVNEGGGGGSAAGGAGGGAAAFVPAQAAPAPLNVRVSGLSGNQLLSGADVSSLLTRLQDEAGDRGLILTTVE